MSETRVLGDAPRSSSGPAARALALLNGDGEEARVVGGAVRNALLKLPIGDIDIATTALPGEVVRRARFAGIKSVPTGIEHGTVTPAANSQPFEVTTLREDVETFGRHAKVAFGRDWRRDAERRDFTINALSVDAGGVVYDYVGGLDDVAARRVRFIGDASRRIAEDYLRILRFFRIHAAYGEGAPDRAGYLACVAALAGLAGLSAERVRMEMLKLMIAKGAAASVTAMAEGGLLLPILGGVAYTGPFAAMIAAEHALGLQPNAVRRLGALGVAVTEDARRLATRLRLTNAEAKALDSMGHRWWRLAGLDEARAWRRSCRPAPGRHGTVMMKPNWRRRRCSPRRRSAAARLAGPAAEGQQASPLRAADFTADRRGPGARRGPGGSGTRGLVRISRWTRPPCVRSPDIAASRLL